MYRIRCIQKSDNAALAKVIRAALKEFGADKPGTVYFDATTDALYELFQTPNAQYWVVELDGEILGGCGIYPTTALPKGYTELVKLYLHPNARGKGLGVKLIQKCEDFALQNGFTHLYLESLPELSNAVSMYQKLGFESLQSPLGKSGHFSCSIWMLKKL